ncbi:MAG: hypothetical protein HRT88_19250, partial [Lentisphaeraceae bacterium]|nr:hypothetical protein [Lentisphaeraceae bacterium]
FLEKVNPDAPGWKKIHAEAEAEGKPIQVQHAADSLPAGILCAVIGSIAVYSLLFAIGYWLYAENGKALVLGLTSVVCTVALFIVWGKTSSSNKKAA